MVKEPILLFESAFETYTPVRQLGEGGAGRVSEVRAADGRPFALKYLIPERTTSERRKRFKNEIDFCRRHQHPNVVRVVDEGLVLLHGTAKVPFYVMPLYDNTLRHVIEAKISPDHVLPLFAQLLDGAESAHLLGVLHRDLKPENALVDKNHGVAIADFGIAHFREDLLVADVKTTVAARLANLRYSAPEQRAKGQTVGLQADIFALGLMLNEMFTGEVPQGVGFKTIASVAPSYAYLDEVVQEMIQQDSNARPANIDAIKRGLIGRQTQFIALQRLDEARRKVVPTAQPAQVPVITLMSLEDFADDSFMFRLNQTPPSGWVGRFHSPQDSYNAPLGAQAGNWTFHGNIAKIRPYNASERMAQDLVNTLNSLISIANRGYQRDMQLAADERERKLQQQLQNEQQQLELKHRILKAVKI